ncbi:MAG: hypothetical protein E6K80_08820, partial [Candidatus Eisenbacteria bacterium]
TVGVPTESDDRLRFDSASPNPFQSRVAFSLRVAAAGEVDVDVLDLAGRRLRVLHRGVEKPGELRLEWNGRDERGRSVAAGVYFAAARAGGATTRVRFIRMP